MSVSVIRGFLKKGEVQLLPKTGSMMLKCELSVFTKDGEGKPKTLIYDFVCFGSVADRTNMISDGEKVIVVVFIESKEFESKKNPGMRFRALSLVASSVALA